ncbi:hypothetical protein [Burkholderia vietnamiensis]|uniref:hypothetical protein n=1 Tax=Burkholderia vietnamiensis TaxID=60552 RepID=UPI001593A79C|nr:hypothetical protein [Burkholderia vietnamiensis]MCA8197321.1 hypothetical protein [Burkholderia vietnamiensis]
MPVSFLMPLGMFVFMLVSALSIRTYQVNGHHIGGAMLVGLGSAIVVVVGIFLIGVVLGLPFLVVEVVKESRHARHMKAIEDRYPGARVTALRGGRWLVTEIATGRTYCELDSDGLTVISPRTRVRSSGT